MEWFFFVWRGRGGIMVMGAFCLFVCSLGLGMGLLGGGVGGMEGIGVDVVDR